MTKYIRTNQDGEKNTLLFCSVFFLLSLGCVLFGVLTLAWWNGKGVACFWVWAFVFTAVVCIGYVFSLICLFKGRERLLKALLGGYIFLFFSLVFLYILQKTGFFAVIKDEKSFQEYLQKTGVWMPLLYILFQFLQVVILPVPSIVSTIAGIALFGAFKTLVYSFIGIVIGSFAAFLVGRKLGNKAVLWIVGEDALKKWKRKLKGKDNLFLSVMFLLPFFPDDVLCFLAGLSSMSWWYFTWIILFSRALGIAATCFSVDFIPFNTWWGIVIWCIFALILTAVFVIVYKNMEKIQQKIDISKGKIRKRK